MSKPIKFVLFAVAVLAIFAGAAVWLLSRVDTKAQFEAAASSATGLQVVVQGDVSISMVPALHATLKRVQVRNRATPIAAIGEAEIAVELLPLLRRQIRVRQLELRDVNAQIERDENGRFNFIAPRLQQVQGLVPAADIARLSFERTNLRYLDRQSSQEISATDCRFEGKDVQLLAGSGVLKNLAFDASVVCAEVRNSRLTVTDVKFSAAVRREVIQLRSLLLRVLGGEGTGEIDLDLSGAIPSYRVSYAVEQLHLDELFKVLASEIQGKGFLDFKASLSMQGDDAASLRRTAQGEASLQGRDLKLAVGDLDQKLARYESSQNFNLVDVGAFLVAGPVGPAVTKSYNFASIFRGTRGETDIRTLVSRWSIENGMAHAQDVALATRANRLAVKGSLDFVNESFNEVSVALLSEQGCVRVEQKISGSFAAPQIKRPSVFRALAGPVSRLVGKAKGLLGLKCQVFYEGSIAP